MIITIMEKTLNGTGIFNQLVNNNVTLKKKKPHLAHAHINLVLLAQDRLVMNARIFIGLWLASPGLWLSLKRTAVFCNLVFGFTWTADSHCKSRLCSVESAIQCRMYIYRCSGNMEGVHCVLSRAVKLFDICALFADSWSLMLPASRVTRHLLQLRDVIVDPILVIE